MIIFKIFILITLVVTLASCIQAAELPEPRGNYPIGITYLSFTAKIALKFLPLILLTTGK